MILLNSLSRPFNNAEKAEGSKPFVRLNQGDCTVTLESPIPGKPLSKTYTFDAVFGPTETQAELYAAVVHPIVEEVLKGFNCTIFAYGQTGTGKTYTMEGSRLRDGEGNCHDSAGVIPRAIKQIFDSLDAAATDASIKVCCLEGVCGKRKLNVVLLWLVRRCRCWRCTMRSCWICCRRRKNS